jgi:fatty-acyl-CoA synthase
MAIETGASLDQYLRRREALERRYPRWTPLTISQSFDVVADHYPDRPCIITDQHIYSYAEMQAWSRQLARGLLALGVAPGEHVAMVMANSAQFVAMKYAIARIGAVAVPLNYQYRTEELGYVLGQSDSAVLVTMDTFWNADFFQSLDALAPGWEGQGGGSALPCLRQVVTWCPAGGGRDGALSLQALGERGNAVGEAELKRREGAGRPDEIADVVYTSGTTGQPKGVMLSHDNVLRCAFSSAYTRGFADGWRCQFALPLYHVFGYVEGLLASMLVGGAVLPQPVFDPDGSLKAVERHRTNELLFVPTMTIAVVERAAKTRYDVSSLESVFTAAAASPVWLWERVQRELDPTYLFTGYGGTEVSASTTLTFPGDPLEIIAATIGAPKLGGVAGDAALAGRVARYKTVDPASGEDLPDGAEGELCAQGPLVMQGYYQQPEATAAVLDAGRWFHSGDVGRIRADGYLELTGRNVDRYKCGGEMVACKEVEELLTRHPAVAQAYVIGVADEQRGEVGCAWVVPADGAQAEARDLIHYCRQHLARFKTPEHVLFLSASELPQTATGKVQKFRLLDMARRQLRPGVE